MDNDNKAITAGASPRPWKTEPSGRVGTECIFDANGVYVATVPLCDAALIVKTVNSYGEDAEYILHLKEALAASNAERDEANEERNQLLREMDDMFDEDVQIRDEHDRLRDLVRRMAKSMEDAVEVMRVYVATYTGTPPDPPHDTLCGVDITELLREAREALGEDAR